MNINNLGAKDVIKVVAFFIVIGVVSVPLLNSLGGSTPSLKNLTIVIDEPDSALIRISNCKIIQTGISCEVQNLAKRRYESSDFGHELVNAKGVILESHRAFIGQPLPPGGTVMSETPLLHRNLTEKTTLFVSSMRGK